MKAKLFIIGLIAISFNKGAIAQNFRDVLISDIELVIKSTQGNNGLAVAYNPKKNVYYSVFAGNASYPLEVHDATTGESIWGTELGVDARGMWFDSECNCLKGTIYDNLGSYQLNIDSKGFPLPVMTEEMSYGFVDQGVTTMNKNYIYSLSSLGMVLKFKVGSTKSKKIQISKNYEDFGNINANAIFHTGIKGFELGFVNFSHGTLLLFNEKSGKLAKAIRIKLDGATVPENFNVSYANERLFLFNTAEKTWKGYKITQ